MIADHLWEKFSVVVLWNYFNYNHQYILATPCWKFGIRMIAEKWLTLYPISPLFTPKWPPWSAHSCHAINLFTGQKLKKVSIIWLNTSSKVHLVSGRQWLARFWILPPVQLMHYYFLYAETRNTGIIAGNPMPLEIDMLLSNCLWTHRETVNQTLSLSSLIMYAAVKLSVWSPSLNKPHASNSCACGSDKIVNQTKCNTLHLAKANSVIFTKDFSAWCMSSWVSDSFSHLKYAYFYTRER